MPYRAAVLSIRSMSGGSVGGGGGDIVKAGWESARIKLSKPPGSTTNRNRDCSEFTRNVCGMSRGPKTNDPAGA